MIASKVQKQPKLNKVVVVAPQDTPGKSAKSAAVAVSAPRVQTSHHQIRERAFQIFEDRGSRHGHDVQDWFRAERQILAQ
jgi:uncharacterized membrane protein